MKSWNTTIAGVLGALALLFTQVQYFFDGNAETHMDMATIVGAVGVLGIGWFARDNHRNSRSVGADK